MILRLLNSNTQDKIELRVKPIVEQIIMPFFVTSLHPLEVVQVVNNTEAELFTVPVSILSYEDIAIVVNEGHIFLHLKGVLVGSAPIQDIDVDTIEMEVDEGVYLVDELMVVPEPVSADELSSWHIVDQPFQDGVDEQQVEMDGSYFGLPPGKSLLILEGDEIDAEGEMVVRFDEVNQ